MLRLTPVARTLDNNEMQRTKHGLDGASPLISVLSRHLKILHVVHARVMGARGRTRPDLTSDSRSFVQARGLQLGTTCVRVSHVEAREFLGR
jgi:hypothetical protein